MKLRAKLALLWSATIIFAIALISSASYFFIYSEFLNYRLNSQKSGAEAHARHIRLQYEEQLQSWNPDYIHGFGMYALNEGYIIKLRDRFGRMVWDAENHEMCHDHEMMEDALQNLDEQRLSGNNFVSQLFPFYIQDEFIGSVEIGYYTSYDFGENEFRFTDALNRILVAAGLMSLILAIIFATFLSRKISEPISRVIKAAGEISGGNYQIGLDGENYVEETRNLSKSIQKMANLLHTKELSQRRILSDIAHELRTPVANISAQLEAMAAGIFVPTPENLERCYNEMGRLSHLISDLQSLHDLENHSDSSSDDVDAYEIMENVLNGFEANISAKNISKSITGQHVIVNADRNRLIQLFSNIISNAVKYTPEGGSIDVSIYQNSTHMMADVRDSGVGIHPDEQELIFERFYRTDKSRTRLMGGAGIGLAIARAIARNHGGDISVKSSPGQGSTFTISILK